MCALRWSFKCSLNCLKQMSLNSGKFLYTSYVCSLDTAVS
jgi:hypothetical protein